MSSGPSISLFRTQLLEVQWHTKSSDNQNSMSYLNVLLLPRTQGLDLQIAISTRVEEAELQTV